MKAVTEDMRTGHLEVSEVPQPELQPGGILVETHYSAISAGTERAKIETGEKNLLQKAMSRPDLVKQVVQYARDNGIRAAYNKVQAKLGTLSTMGYSAAGVVLAVGEGVQEFDPGDRVACAGAGYANHAEINFIPRNLAVRVPDGVDLASASLTTIGAVAMQGLRQSDLRVGESVAVIGAGLLGMLTIQLARAAGLRVVAIDLDARRLEVATKLGAQLALNASDPDLAARVQEFTRYGIDAALITAASQSSAPLETAALLARDRAKLVVVGDVGMGVPRRDLYMKELSVHLSRSYGPGRYDPAYEEGGQDYPVGYVRWTERRNMEAFVDLLASGAIDVSTLTANRYPIAKAVGAYEEIRNAGSYTALLEYPAASGQAKAAATAAPMVARAATGEVRVGCIGAGGFARDIIFPALKAGAGVKLVSVASSTGATAESARRNFGFARAETTSELLRASDVDAVFVLSRHDSHAKYVTEAVAAGKAVFVEKPLAATPAQLELVETACRAKGNAAFVMVGFNRRFAPMTQKLIESFAGRREPMLITIRVNAGYIPKEHWTQQNEAGGRIVGELCHFVDWARAVVGKPIRKIAATALPDGARYNRDNVIAVLTFEDGSAANITYQSNGDKSVPKEWYEVSCEGNTARIDDFKRIELHRQGKATAESAARDKGHRREMDLTLTAMKNGAAAPIPFAELMEVTRATFDILRAIATGTEVTVGHKVPVGGND